MTGLPLALALLGAYFFGAFSMLLLLSVLIVGRDDTGDTP